MTTKEMVEVMLAFEAGAKIESRAKGGNDEMWMCIKEPQWAFPFFDYRVAPEPAKPKLRAWKLEEVPLGAQFRVGAESKYNASSVCVDGVWILGCAESGKTPKAYLYSFKEMLSSATHSIDGGKTWHPCGIAE